MVLVRAGFGDGLGLDVFCARYQGVRLPKQLAFGSFVRVAREGRAERPNPCVHQFVAVAGVAAQHNRQAVAGCGVSVFGVARKNGFFERLCVVDDVFFGGFYDVGFANVAAHIVGKCNRLATERSCA